MMALVLLMTSVAAIALASDMQRVSDFVQSRFGYNPGSYTSYPADESNHRLLARLDWNITDAHHLSVRYNNTKNVAWNSTNGNSSDTGYRLNGTYRIGAQSMAFSNSLYSQENKVQSISADLHSRFGQKMSNQLLFTYTNIEDMRGSDSSEFPFIDIMAGKDANGNQIMEPYMSLGYELNENNHQASNKISGVASDFKMPQQWKTSIAVDYQIPVSFPFTATAEFMYTKNINAVTIDNINIKDADGWERFSGADNRLIYPKDFSVNGNAKQNAVLLTNTSKGHGYTFNITLNAQPLENLNLMAAYTHTEQKEVSGLPGSDPISTWQGLNTVNGSNFTGVQRSNYVVPDKLIASVGYYIPFTHKGLTRGLCSRW